MNKKTIKDVDVKGKRVLVRVDFNVPMADGQVTDDRRIRAALPTIQYLLDGGASVVLMSHLGRPKGEPDPKFQLDAAGERLSELLNRPVQKLDEKTLAALKAASSSGTIKIINLIKSIQITVSEEGEANPFLWSIGERAEAVADLYDDRQTTTQDALRRLEELVLRDRDRDLTGPELDQGGERKHRRVAKGGDDRDDREKTEQAGHGPPKTPRARC